MARWLKYVLLLAVLLLIGSIPLAKQVDTGSIEGTITNDRGPLAKASIEARNVMTGTVSRAESDVDGRYRIGDLRPGRYSLWVQASGHDSMWILQTIVERGKATRKDLRLEGWRPIVSGL
jgi:hypothetical protein